MSRPAAPPWNGGADSPADRFCNKQGLFGRACRAMKALQAGEKQGFALFRRFAVACKFMSRASLG